MRYYQLFEASYDGMIMAMRAKYPTLQTYINDQLKWAKTILKKDEKIVWYMKSIRNDIAQLLSSQPNLLDIDDPEQLEEISLMLTDISYQDNIGHYFGFNIPAIDNYQFGNKTFDQIKADLDQIVEKWQNATQGPIPVQQGDHELIKFNDGSAWWWVDRSYCKDEGKWGKHCGNVTGQHKTDQRILSYRIKGEVKLTFILESDGTLGEMKAYNNQKPPEKYHPHIVSLLLNDKIKGIAGGGYLQDNNFSVFDLNDEQLKTVQEKKPSLITDQIKISPREAIRAPAWIRLQNIDLITKLSPGIQYIIDQSTGEYKNDVTAWTKAIDADTSLSLSVPDNLIDKFKTQILNALEENPSFLITQASRSIRTNWDILKDFVTFGDTDSIAYIQPTTPRYTELCEIAVSENGWALKYVPKEFKTLELCKIAVSQDGRVIGYVPNAFKTPELCKIAVNQTSQALDYLPEEFRTPDLYISIVSRNGVELANVPKKLRSPDLCKKAVNQTGLALQFVPKELRTPDLCKIAVSNYGRALVHVPDELKTVELCKIATDEDRIALAYVPAELKSKVKQELASK